MKAVRLSLLLAMLADAARAQGLPASVRGRVTAAGGAEVSLTCGGEVDRTVATGADGSFAIGDLPAGRCRLQARGEDHDPGPATEVALAAGEERTVTLVLGAERRRWLDGVRRSGHAHLASTLPLVTSRVEALLQAAAALDGDRGPWGSIVAGPLHGNTFSVDHFDLTHPLRGGPGFVFPMSGRADVELTSTGQGVDGAWAGGARTAAFSLSGSNRAEVEAAASELRAPGDLGETAAVARASGPIIKDRLWIAAAGQGLWSRGSSAAGSAKLVWQATSRQKLSLLVLGGRETAVRDRSHLVGLTWELLITDNVVARVAAGSRSHGDPDGDSATGWQTSGELEIFGQLAGDHAARLGARNEIMQARNVVSVPGQRTELTLEDAWRLERHLTVTPGLAYVAGSFARLSFAEAGPGWHARGLAPQLALVWDATGDGRTALRASAGSSIDAGSFGHARALPPEVVPAPRTWEVAAGIDREVLPGLGARADLVQRWRPGRDPADPGPRDHRGLTLALRKREGRLRGALSYTRQTTAGAENVVHLAASEEFSWGFGGGLLVSYANPVVWTRLRDLPRIPTEAAAGGSAWFVSANLHAGLAPLVGEPMALWLDLVNVLSAPAVRLGLAWTY